MSSVLSIASRIKGSVGKTAWDVVRRKRLASYLKSDRRPWREGYHEYREKSLSEAVNDDSLLDTLAANRPLPDGYGYRLDARIIEIPWVLSRVRQVQGGRFLDAGSALNYDFVLDSPPLKDKQTTIVTLAPEGQAFWQLGVSYVFGDLRDLDFRDERFDAVACISTIEHIGMDNTMYAEDLQIAQRSDKSEFILAVKELKRVLKAGGSLFISFPFGRYENHGWFQQFDSALVDTLVNAFAPSQHHEAIFQYHPDGWRLSNREACKDCEFFDVHTSKYEDPNSTIEYPSDYPAGERGLACLELKK
ncbi:MAG TPA: methyltransferase domain-containing protein [Pyrinomonadaceae bacterium]|jgi:SAM-dependent methyltransferase|nr:methyltransferase domain-containing protein [Pyrinomonadaceae bacterium]